MEPEDGRQSDCKNQLDRGPLHLGNGLVSLTAEPASEQGTLHQRFVLAHAQEGLKVTSTHNQTQQIVENRDRLCDDPGDDPDANADCDPGPNGQKAATVHLVGTAEHAHVDVLAGDVTQHNTRENRLYPSVDIQRRYCKIGKGKVRKEDMARSVDSQSE